ncbi:glutathione S-transferase family protein [Elioraea rosea]|uniref:glutathione S-transferase family protein n=1 Tax=Elioraea rosea TaxID=2492390 RepID=UPI0013155345|nr:glutathione S-transferase family protein [Elioraea rosea]
MAELVLYGNDVSGYCCKVRIILAHKHRAWRDEAPPDGYGSPAYRAIVPAGTIPALVQGNLVLSESEAIAEYLDEAWPDPPMLPGDAAARGRLRQLARFHDSRLEPPLRALFAHVAPEARDDATVDRQMALYAQRLGELASLAVPRPLLGGEALTLADCGYPATFMLGRGMAGAFGLTVAMPEALASYEKALAAHPSVMPALARCRAATEQWFAAKLGRPLAF